MTDAAPSGTPSPGYPAHLVRHESLADGTTITIRPIRPEDDRLVHAFLDSISTESGWNRLLSGRRLTPAEVDHLTHIDYEHEMALIAVTDVGGEERELGVARYVVDDDGAGAEFALLITDTWQRKGIGSLLLSALLKHARSAGLARMHGITYATNKAMIDLGRKLGFERVNVPDDATVRELVMVLAAADSL